MSSVSQAECNADGKMRGFELTSSPTEVTAMLRYWRNGDRERQDELFRAVYDELHRQAARYLRRELPGLTLQSSDLIHEAYLRLIDQRDVEWQNRLHFYAIAAQQMRRILVDHARQRHAAKRGGSNLRLPLDEAESVPVEPELDFVALDQVLNRLSEIDSQQSRIVELRFFSGLSVEETAEVLGISERTVKRDWHVAKAWLRRELSKDKGSGDT